MQRFTMHGLIQWLLIVNSAMPRAIFLFNRTLQCLCWLLVSRTHTHMKTHTHARVRACVCVCVCACVLDII